MIADIIPFSRIYQEQLFQRKSIFNVPALRVNAQNFQDESMDDMKPSNHFFDLSYKFSEGEGVLSQGLYN